MVMQAPKARPGEGGSTIDFSTLFAELDSDFSSDESDGSEDSDGSTDEEAAHKDLQFDGGERHAVPGNTSLTG